MHGFVFSSQSTNEWMMNKTLFFLCKLALCVIKKFSKETKNLMAIKKQLAKQQIYTAELYHKNIL
jgi:hypothetical protein